MFGIELEGTLVELLGVRDTALTVGEAEMAGRLGDLDAAASIYDDIEPLYEDSPAAANLGFYRARLAAMR